MSVIEKIEKYAKSVRSYGSDWTDESPYSDGRQKGLEKAIEFIESDPAYTAREKARKVAELWKLSSQYSPVVHWDGYRKQWLAEDDYPLTLMMESVPLDLTPTPEEIATGCCCYVVPKKGETDAIHS